MLCSSPVNDPLLFEASIAFLFWAAGTVIAMARTKNSPGYPTKATPLRSLYQIARVICVIVTAITVAAWASPLALSAVVVFPIVFCSVIYGMIQVDTTLLRPRLKGAKAYRDAF